MIIFFKIRCFWLEGDTLTGVVNKLTALTVGRYDAFFDAEHLLIIYFCSTGAIAA